ncbi:hypothetical protein CEXT_786501 [Caerostris extrusa]|uniref:Uncharacterized protein n=1 Tax=Caerostris extrusa TaxID=172846 RepID=A0AAV4RMJ2_CAEEX|nr:hypothetical protein CEXT_786501 [Caerostris extrusa]
MKFDYDKPKDAEESAIHIPHDSNTVTPVSDESKISMPTTEGATDVEHVPDSTKHQKLEKKKTKRRRTQDRTP